MSQVSFKQKAQVEASLDEMSLKEMQQALEALKQEQKRRAIEKEKESVPDQEESINP